MAALSRRARQGAAGHLGEHAPISEMHAGDSLIIVLPAPANVHYGFDGWQNMTDAPTTPNSLGVHVLHLDTSKLEPGQRLDFTYWNLPSGASAGADYRISISAAVSPRSRAVAGKVRGHGEASLPRSRGTSMTVGTSARECYFELSLQLDRAARRSQPSRAEAFRQAHEIRIGQIRAEKPSVVSFLLIAAHVAVTSVVEDDGDEIDRVLDGGRQLLAAEQKPAITA